MTQTAHKGMLRQGIRRMHRLADGLAGRDGLSLREQLWVALVAAVALFSRWPSLFVRAQFYAEDGMIWFSQAYEQGFWHALRLSDGGYLNTLQRLGAGLSMLVPFRWAPLVMVLFGLFIQLLPLAILLSPRMRNWAPLPVRALMALIYVVSPNAREIHVVLTNCQWHLALCALLLALSCPPATWRGRAFDLAVVAVSGISGPFSLLLAPLLLVYCAVRRRGWTLALLVVDGVCAAVQVSYLRTDAGIRDFGPLGASLPLLLRMLGGNIAASALFGGYPFARYVPMALIAPAALGLLLLLGYTLWKAPLEWRLFIVFAGMLLAAALKSPLIQGPVPLWEMLTRDSSARYWFFPMMAFLWSAVWCTYNAPAQLFRVGARWTLLLLSIGIVDNWVYKPFPDTHFPTSARRFEAARPGEIVDMPIQPQGLVLELQKR